MQSGCGLAESTAAVLPVLAARFEEWGFVTLDLWEQVDQAISNVVDHVTLADLVDKQRRIDARCSERAGCSCH